ncbi:MAG: sulfate adenylyltransferase, partial [Planctomycetota bacterium]
MVKPHGSDSLNPLFVADEATRAKLLKEAEGLTKLLVCSQAAANAVMMASGYFNPLTGFMNLADSLSVAEGMKTTGGLFWPVPIVNVVVDVSGIKDAKRIALLDPNVDGNPVLAIQDIESIDEATDAQMQFMAEKVYGTTVMEHPGVNNFLSVGKFFVAGPIQVLNYSYFAEDFPETFRTAVQIREMIEKNGWSKVVAFQTRNPMHRAHEALVKIAMERVGADGSVIHMLLGKLKEGDI